MPSWKKLNTYGVESPCGCSPGVGEERAYPGLSEEQLVPSCEMRLFMVANTFIRILIQHRRSCVVSAFIIVDVSIEILVHFGVNCIMKCTFQRRRCCVFDSPGLPNDSAGYPGLTYVMRGTTP